MRTTPLLAPRPDRRAELLELHPAHLELLEEDSPAAAELRGALRCVFCPVCVVHSTRIVPEALRAASVIPWICDRCSGRARYGGSSAARSIVARLEARPRLAKAKEGERP